MPDAFRPWITDLCERMQVPPDFPAATAVVQAGALIGRQVGVRPKREDDWLVIPNLFGTVVGRPSLLKTPSMREALKPIHELEAEARDQHEEAMRIYAAEMKVYKAEEKIAAKDLENTLKGKGVRDQLVRKLLEEDGEPEKPVRTRYPLQRRDGQKTGRTAAR